VVKLEPSSACSKATTLSLRAGDRLCWCRAICDDPWEKVTNLFPKPNLAPHLGCRYLGAKGAWTWGWCTGVVKVTGEVSRPSGSKDKMLVLPALSIEAILPFNGIDQEMSLNGLVVGNCRIYCPVL